MSRYAHAAYCDDIRQEINGKMSLMGLYSDTMLLPRFPNTLAKLGIVVTAKTPGNMPFAGFSIHIVKGEEQLAELVVSEEEYKAGTPQLGSEKQDNFLQAQFVISPLAVKEPGKIEVIFKSGDWEYSCNSLNIELAPEGSLQS